MTEVVITMLVGLVAYLFGVLVGSYMRKRKHVATLFIDTEKKLIRVEWNLTIDEIKDDVVFMDVQEVHL